MKAEVNDSQANTTSVLCAGQGLICRATSIMELISRLDRDIGNICAKIVELGLTRVFA